jgi:hypothetical protein
VRPLLIGEDNPYGCDPYYALYCEPPNSAGGRLCRKVLGLTPDEYLSRFDRVNLCSRKWRIADARSRASELRIDRPGGVFVLLGAKVASAFGWGFRPFGVSEILHHSRWQRFVMLPHPSGRCRLWNEPGAFARALSVLAEAGVLGPAPGESVIG